MEDSINIVNGSFGAEISVMDRGLLYGDGLFETMLVRNKAIQYWQGHLQRLQSGCDALNIECPSESILLDEINQIIQDELNCVIKIIVTRGVGERGYKPISNSPTRIIQRFSLKPIPADYYVHGVNITLCDMCIAIQPKLAGIKHLNRLEQVLARSEWNDEYQEGLVCDSNGNIIEATSSNVFFESEGKLYTPNLNLTGVAGVLRSEIISFCESNAINLSIQEIPLEQIQNYTGMLLCNSVIGIWPVKRFNAQQFNKTAIIERLMSKFNQ